MRRTQRTAIAATTLLAALAVPASFAAADPGPVQKVSSNPVVGCTAGQANGQVFLNADTEPYVSVDPNHSLHSIVTWQQDRFSNGGAHAGAYAWTSDGSHYSVGVLPFGQCSGVNDYHRISDLWVSWGPDGAAYASALQFDENTARGGVGAATTFDSGATWQYSQPVIADNNFNLLDDKNSVTADQLHAGVAYQVWDRLDFTTNITGPALFSVTHDHGKTWSTPSTMVNTPAFTQTIGNVIVEDASGKLYDFFNQITYNTAFTPVDIHYAMVTSTDEGTTWSAPTPVTLDTSVNEVDPNDSTKQLRAGGGLPSVALDPASGKIYLAYEGSNFSGGAYDQVQLVTSSNGGASWSAPILASAPGVAAFTPSLAVDAQGTLNVSFYDLRFLQPGNTTTLPTARWERTFAGGNLSTSTESQTGPQFDWLKAPFAGGYMLGDYEGMSSAGTYGVQSVFVASLNAPDPTDVYTSTFHGPFGAAVSGGSFTSPTLTSHGAHETNR